MNHIITTDALTKLYNRQAAVSRLDLKIPQGSIYGFLGPNGAGKSTTMKMLLGLTKPTRGTITIFGQEMNSHNRLAILRHTGSLIESPAYYGHLSGRENLQILCKLKNIPEKDIDRVLTIVRMKKQKDKKVGQYSLGMKQRLGLAGALLGNPKIIFLDEPTNGLDPAGIQEMRELICALPDQGITVLVSSHLLTEIDQTATDVGIIDRGELIFQDTLTSLHEHSRPQIILRTNDDGSAYFLLKTSHIPVEQKGDTLYLRTSDEAQIMKSVQILVGQNIGILRLQEQQLSLEDIFLKLTGRQVSL